MSATLDDEASASLPEQGRRIAAEFGIELADMPLLKRVNGVLMVP